MPRGPLLVPEMEGGHGPHGWLGRGTARNNTHPGARASRAGPRARAPDIRSAAARTVEDYRRWVSQQGGVG